MPVETDNVHELGLALTVLKAFKNIENSFRNQILWNTYNCQPFYFVTLIWLYQAPDKSE